MAIVFYKINDKYGCFSNFALFGFELNGKYWRTGEHYFQAQKFHNTKFEEEIRMQKNPKNAAEMGRNHNLPLRNDWEFIKDNVMREAVFAKFSQNRNIGEILLSTGRESIIEAADYDYYWGCGKDGSGKNMLGVILMEVREKLLCDRLVNFEEFNHRRF